MNSTSHPDGVTPAEQFLTDLCRKSFLSLWSYANVYNNRGKSNGGRGEELCDLLVVFGDHVIIFSDKNCEYPTTSDEQLNWGRWYRKAVKESAQQIWGAEKWIRKYPDQLYLDKECQRKLPIDLPPAEQLKFHRIVVAHGVSPACQRAMTGSGSLIIDTTIIGAQHHDARHHFVQPFTIGLTELKQGYVHVLDDSSLWIVMNMQNTITDFVDYLSAKEALLCHPDRQVWAAGEDDLLALYLDRPEGAKSAFLPANATVNAVFVEPGRWELFIQSSKFQKQSQADRVSFLWDKIIELVSGHIREGTLHSSSSTIFADQEYNLRVMAQEPRRSRRILSEALDALIQGSKEDALSVQLAISGPKKEVGYVFFLYPYPAAESHDHYRKRRLEALAQHCMVAKLRFFPNVTTIIGITSEAGGPTKLGSFDVMRYPTGTWLPFEKEAAEALHASGLIKDFRPQ